MLWDDRTLEMKNLIRTVGLILLLTNCRSSYRSEKIFGAYLGGGSRCITKAMLRERLLPNTHIAVVSPELNAGLIWQFHPSLSHDIGYHYGTIKGDIGSCDRRYSARKRIEV